jgi:signal transduction histidine kinase
MIKRLVKLLRLSIGTISKIVALLVEHEMMARRQLEMRTQILARQEAQYRMNEFLSVAGHELKTPLTSIKGNIQLLARRLKKGVSMDIEQLNEPAQTLAEAQELLERTDQQLTRLTRIVNTLIDSSRIQSNTLNLFLELCEMNAIVKDVAQDRRYIPSTRDLRIELPTDKAIFVMADANRIKQVIIHYLTNAHKYSKPDRPITLQLQEEEGRVVRVLVCDEGPGIPIEEQRHIWDCFYRVPDIPVENGTEVGLGLGLYVSKAIIEQHHGQVGVQSTPGLGSIFWFTLPTAKQIIGMM